jgi:anti-sigma regulatory factor (Ser/Thr protein kinase)
METTIDVQEQSQVAEVRRVVAHMGASLALSDADLGRAALVATEASTNLVKYGKRGRVTLATFREDAARGIDIVALDEGPGFADFDASLRDGHSTSGSLGIGLGTIVRAADAFDVHTAQGVGSALYVRIAKGAANPAPQGGRLLTGSRSMPKPGQLVCGDGWACGRAGRWQRLCVVDGLGHGPIAAAASEEALRVFLAASEQDSPADILQRTHQALRSTRGVVMGVVAIDTAAGAALFAGVGNIMGVLQVQGETHHLLSVEGVVGYNMRAVRERTFPWAPDGVAVMATDGLSTRWNLARYPGLALRHPQLVAAVLHRDFARDTDDSTIAVAKEAP